MKEQSNTQINSIFSSIDALASRANVSRQKAFSAWYAEHFFDADEDEILDLVALDGGEDQGIDLVYADARTFQIYVIQAHCPENTQKSTPKQKWDAVISSIPAYENHELFLTQGRKELYEYIDELKELHPTYDVTFGLISLGQHSDSIAKSVDNTKQSETFNRFDFFYFSQSEIINRYASLIASEKSIPEDTLKFDTGYLKDHGKYGKAWFGSISASELIRLHGTYKDNLFSGNVRLFMGARKGGINEHIVKTAKDQPGIFWALNNGISIVANSVDEIDDKLIKLRRFSIVNGCQTTSCLATAAANDAKVLVRVIAAAPSIVSDIVRYNNSQNAVKIWAVRSVDDTQERLRSEFLENSITYAPKQAGTKQRRDGQKIIELDKLTQYLASTNGDYLIQAINAKTELFDQPYQNIFTHDISPAYVYLYWRIGILADSSRQDRISKLKEDQVDKISSSLLGVSGSYWIIFCAAKLISAENKSLATQLKLKKQLTEEFESALKKYVHSALDFYFDIAIDTYDEETFGTVRSALRSPKFLQKFEQKFNNKLASKIKQYKLPALAHTLKSIKD